MRSLWQRDLVCLFTHRSSAARRTAAELQVPFLNRRFGLLISALMAAAIAIVPTAALNGQSAHPLFQVPPLPKFVPGNFRDITSELGIDFRYLSSHTSKKYLIETMGTGVALFDFDNDGRLD